MQPWTKLWAELVAPRLPSTLLILTARRDPRLGAEVEMELARREVMAGDCLPERRCVYEDDGHPN
jgi:hypothetical protein